MRGQDSPSGGLNLEQFVHVLGAVAEAYRNKRIRIERVALRNMVRAVCQADGLSIIADEDEIDDLVHACQEMLLELEGITFYE
jgi:hypothetical protein